MATFKANGDRLEGTHMTPSYPDPATQNVNCLPIDFSLGVGNQVFDRTAPSVPGSAASPSHTATAVVLTWAASSDNFGVDHYNIYSGTALIGTTKNLTATISGLTTATAYSFSVTAVDKRGNESAKSGAVAVTTS